MKKLGWKSSRDCSKILRKPWQSWLGAPKQGSPVRSVLHCGQSWSCAVWSKCPCSECCGRPTALVAGCWQSPRSLQQVVWEAMWGASLHSCHICVATELMFSPESKGHFRKCNGEIKRLVSRLLEKFGHEWKRTESKEAAMGREAWATFKS